MRRRQLLTGAAGALLLSTRPLRAGAPKKGEHWSLKDITVSGDRDIGQRFTLLVPEHVGDRKVPLLVALHGLGETHDQRVGAHAWVERYGLGSCYDRLCDPPIERANPSHRYWKDERLEEVNALLGDQPFRGLAVACPYTPNVYEAPRGRTRTLDAYAEWITSEVVPRARKEANVYTDVEHTFLDGCSLGGYVGAEVFTRKPEHFCAWGTVQGALGGHRVARYAEEIAEIVEAHGKRHIHVETSTADAFRSVNERFAKELKKRGVPHDFIMPPGPHNQPFLRDSGTVEMLLWHDRLPR